MHVGDHIIDEFQPVNRDLPEKVLALKNNIFVHLSPEPSLIYGP
jgi:hypothetical protein